MTEAGSEILFRPHRLEDIPFIHSSWGESYYKGSGAQDFLSPEEFHSFHRPIRDAILTKPSATIIIASPVIDPDLIAGWCAVGVLPSSIILHYVYVKATFRKEGIASELLKRATPSSKVVYSHLTHRASRIMARHYEKFRSYFYLPHAI